MKLSRAAHSFCTFCRCFALLQRETYRNFLVTRFMKEMLYVFSFTFFAAVHFYLASVAASISHFLTAATLKIFMLFFQGKKNSALVLSPALDLCRFSLVELRWPVAYFLFFSVFLLLYIQNLWT